LTNASAPRRSSGGPTTVSPTAQRLSKTGSFITDLAGDDHNWSEETYRIFEFQPGTKVTLQRIQAIIHLDDRPSFESMIARAMSGVDVTFSFRIVVE
jgi:hypothetical protein